MYNFRIFERRLGSRKFASHLLAFVTLTGLFEWTLTVLANYCDPKLHSGLLSIGPFGLVLPWFLYYYQDIPSLNSTSFLGLRITGKLMPYLLGLQVILGSVMSNTIVATSSIVSLTYCIIKWSVFSVLYFQASAFFVKRNILWIQNWLVIPKFVGDITQK